MQNNDPTIQEAMRLAQSPAGRQLIALLQQQGGAQLQDAMEKAAAGDLSQAKQALSSLLNTAEAKALLDKMGR